MCTFDIKEIAKQQDLNIVLGIAQSFLAIMFIVVGAMNTFSPIDQMTVHSPWVKEFPGIMRFIGNFELASGLVLMISLILRVNLILTAFAALGLFIIMMLGMNYNIKHSDYLTAIVNFSIACTSVFVMWGRLKNYK